MVPQPTFEEVFENELDFVCRSLTRFGVASADLSDVAQEVFLTVSDLLEDYDPERPIRPWLFAIAYRFALRYRSRWSKRTEVLADVQETISPEPFGEEKLDMDRARAIALRALDTIEPNRRAMFVMCELEGAKVTDIATALAIPLNTAYSRLRLAREDFHRAVSALGGRP